jgi:hypothetical protein
LIVTTDAETADHLTRRRTRVLPVLALLFVSQQGVYLSGTPGSTVSTIKIGAWFVMTAVLLLLLATGGGIFRSRAVRALMNDETTRAHRNRALAFGFWTTMATGLLLYVLSVFEMFDPRAAVHIMMTVGIASALLSFAAMERKALA